MEQKDDKKKEPAFPEGYEYLDELMTNAIQRQREIEKELEYLSKNTSKPKSYPLVYRPQGFDRGQVSNNQDYMQEKLKNEEKEIEKKVIKRIEREIEQTAADPDIAKQIREVTIEKLYPNPFDGKTPQQIKHIEKMNKDLDTSQNFALTKLKNAREQGSKTNEVTIEPKKDTKNKEFTSLSMRFTQSLSYTKAMENSDKHITPSKDKETPDKD